MPRFALPSARAALARPAVLATATTVALAAVLGGGLVVAGASGVGPLTEVEATAAPSPSAEALASGTGTGTGTSGTTSGGDDNVAVAANTRDGSTVYAVRLKVSILNSDPSTVDSGNAAVAVASCTDCQTVAIALEGVVVTGDAEVVAPENIALAINSGCTGCQTLAYAYQNLQTVDGRSRMTGEGRRQVAALRQQLNALRTSGLDIVAVKAEVDRIAREFAQVLDTTIVAVGKPAGASPSSSPSAAVSPAPGTTGTSPTPAADASGTGSTSTPAPASSAPASPAAATSAPAEQSSPSAAAASPSPTAP